MSLLSVITPDGVNHDYIAGELAAVEYAKNQAMTYPGKPVQIVGAAEDGTAINATITWTATDGIQHTNNLPALTR